MLDYRKEVDVIFPGDEDEPRKRYQKGGKYGKGYHKGNKRRKGRHR